MMDDGEVESKTETKVPMFDGKKSSWKKHKVKMESHLQRIGLGDLFREEHGREIPQNDADLEDDDDEEILIKKKKQNRRAAGILLNSISLKTKRGEAAFSMTERWHSEELGHRGGHFWNE